MKTIQHFIITEYERKYSKTYGGSTYVLSLYENLGKGKLKHLGQSKKHSTGSHKGEISEAYTDLKAMNVIKPSILKAITKAQKDREISGSYESYYYYDFVEKFGLQIEII